VTGANYSAYWRISEKNVLIASLSSSASQSKMWLNGTELTVISSAVSTVRYHSDILVGKSETYANYFDGIIHEIILGRGALNSEEGLDLYQEDEVQEVSPEKALLWLPFRRVIGAGTAGDPKRTPNLGSLGSACDAYLGDNGQGGTDEPTLVSPHGFSFDGGDYLTVPDNASLSFGDGAGNDSPFSLATILRNQRGAGASSGVLGKGVFPASMEFAIFYDGTSLSAIVVDNVTGGYRGRSVSDNGGSQQLTSVVMTYDGTKAATGVKLYKDGIRVDTASVSVGAYNGITPGGGGVLLGVASGAVSSFVGSTYETAVFPFELTPRQVSILTEQMLSRVNV
jgi:hypothetical protein